MERRIIVFCVLVISLVVLPLAISAQEEEKSATGCFNKADREGYYVLTDKSSGEETIVTGLDALEPHSSNHEVTVTGHDDDRGGRQRSLEGHRNPAHCWDLYRSLSSHKRCLRSRRTSPHFS